MKTLPALAALLLAAALPASAQNLDDLASQLGSPSTRAAGKSTDAALKAKMDATGYKYEIDGDGDFRLTLGVGNDRTQLLFVITHTEAAGKLVVREIWSRAYKINGNLSASEMRRYLEDNNKKKVGAWRIMGSGDKQYLVYAIHLPDNATSEQLKSAIEVVAVMADKEELAVAGNDDQ